MSESENPLQILIVEDSPEDALSMGRLLHSDPYGDYKVKAVETGTEGLQLCDRHMPDCILLDLNLPDMNGLEFLSQLVAGHGKYAAGIVMLTGQGNDEIAHEAMNLGTNDYISKNALTRGEMSRAIRNAVEVTAVHRDRNVLMGMAFHDALTGLGNRTMFDERLEETLTEAKNAGAKFGVMVISLDGFSQVVDVLGRSAGDATLRVFGTRLVSALELSDTAVRLGNDEFAVITTSSKEGERVVTIAENIIRQTEAPVDYEGRDLTIGVSIGAAIYPDHGTEADLLVRNADTSMHLARGSGGGVVVYSND